MARASQDRGNYNNHTSNTILTIGVQWGKSLTKPRTCWSTLETGREESTGKKQLKFWAMCSRSLVLSCEEARPGVWTDHGEYVQGIYWWVDECSRVKCENPTNSGSRELQHTEKLSRLLTSELSAANWGTAVNKTQVIWILHFSFDLFSCICWLYFSDHIRARWMRARKHTRTLTR